MAKRFGHVETPGQHPPVENLGLFLPPLHNHHISTWRPPSQHSLIYFYVRMAANNYYEDSDREFSRPQGRTTPARLKLPPLQEENQIFIQTSRENMPTMALRSSPLPSMMQHMAFEDQSHYSSARPRTQIEPVELPSIRQVR